MYTPRLGGLIGPYGGTPESEHRRPVLMALSACATFVVMLLLLPLLAISCGDFLGPVLLLVTSALHRPPPAQADEKARARHHVRERVIAGAYYAAVAITLFTIYIGGVPVKWQASGGKLRVGLASNALELPVTWETAADGSVWLFTPTASTSLGGLPPEFDGHFELWLRPHNRGGQFTLPLWVDTFRWLLVAALLAAEMVGLLLITRLLTEVVFPSLPNSVRAKPGLLASLFPFMRIHNAAPKADAPEDDEAMLPGSEERAPRR